jgi:1,4-dihydroxy-2-naphthoate octaprenyltransferase
MSYHGLGDLLVWVFFGFVPVIGTYYVQAGELHLDVWLLSAACGLCVDTLLVLNNYRDRETDRKTGKRTIIVLFGERFGSLAYLLQGIAAYICVAILSTHGNLWLAILPAFYLLPHYLTWRKMVQINNGPELNRILGFTSRNMLTFAILVVVAYVSSRMAFMETLF